MPTSAQGRRVGSETGETTSAPPRLEERTQTRGGVVPALLGSRPQIIFTLSKTKHSASDITKNRIKRGSHYKNIFSEKSRMKASVLLFVVACVFLPEGTQGEDYPDPVALTNKANEENLTNILKCFYSEGECPKGTVELKAIFPTVAVSACSNCNPTQKQWFRIVGRYLLANRPADIKKLRETFDPSEEHKEEFLKFITSDD